MASADWSCCRNVLCIRPDNMGDVIMAGPAFRALKETFRCRITLLTSTAGSAIARSMHEIDDVLVADLPWIKTASPFDPAGTRQLVEMLRARQFDGAVIFSVYSQNPVASIFLSWLAGIPKRLAYCRENVYELLTDWVPDPEPYDAIRHQVRRDLDLVGHIGAVAGDDSLRLHQEESRWPAIEQKLRSAGLRPHLPWLVLHPGVSEPKRMFPEGEWVKIGKKLAGDLSYQVVVTGSRSETDTAASLAGKIGENCVAVAGLFTVDELILLIRHAALLLSVNTATIHIAAAVATPTIVLYALSNPQHLPWRGTGALFTFLVPADQKSRNEVIRYVDRMYEDHTSAIEPQAVVEAARLILSEHAGRPFPELVPALAHQQVAHPSEHF